MKITIGVLFSAALIAALLCACVQDNRQPAGEPADTEHTLAAPVIRQDAIDVLAVARSNHADWFQPPQPEQEHAFRSRFDIALDQGSDEKTAGTVISLQQETDITYRKQLTKAQAMDDIAFLMDYLQNGYVGYAYFGGAERFDPIRTELMNAVQEMGDEIRVLDLKALLQESLYPVVTDSHFYVGSGAPGDSLDSFAVPERYQQQNGAYIEMESGNTLTEIAVNGTACLPEEMLVPWLDPDGQLCYRLILRGKEPPAAQLVYSGQEVEAVFHPIDTGGDFRGNKGRAWERKTVERTPVLHCYSLDSTNGNNAAQLEAFARTGKKLRKEPYIILDLRGNGGGNATYGLNWLTNLTGHGADAFDIGAFAMLFSDTVMASSISDLLGEWYSEEYAKMKESGEAPRYSLSDVTEFTDFLESDRTIFVLLDRGSASAAENFAVYLAMLENTVLVGTPTAGCFHFGNVVSHSLPHSRLSFQCGTSALLLPDLELREGIGFEPDIWCDADRALDSVVALTRQMRDQ